MSFLTGKGSKVYVGQYDLSAYFQSADAEQNCQSQDTTTFGNNWRRVIGGLKDGSVSLSGLFDATALAIDPILHGLMGDDTGSVVTVGLGGGALGDRCRLIKAKPSSYPISDPVDGLITVSADLQPDGGVDAGDILKALAAETAATDQTGVDNGFATSNGGVLHFHCTAASGTSPTLDGTLEHSSDNSSWSAVTGGAITQATAAGSQRVEVAAGTTINRYTRWSSTTIGGTDTPTFTYAAAFARR